MNANINRKLIAVTFLGLASLGLSGCVVNVGDGRTTVYAGAGSDTIEGANAQTTIYSEASDIVNAATGARPTVVNVEIDNTVGDRGVRGADGAGPCRWPLPPGR